MALFPDDGNTDFIGVVWSALDVKSRGIYDSDTLRENAAKKVSEYFSRAGIRATSGYRPGIGSATGSPSLEDLLGKIPFLGRAIIVTVRGVRLGRRKIADWNRRRLRPFRPQVAIHLDLWLDTNRRVRKATSELVELLELLPSLLDDVNGPENHCRTLLLITTKDRARGLPAIRLDSDTANYGTLMKLAARIERDLDRRNAGTHYIVFKQWGVRDVIKGYSDEDQAFHLIHLFPEEVSDVIRRFDDPMRTRRP